MKRIVVELPRGEVGPLETRSEFRVVESFRVLHQFRLDRKSFGGICRVKFTDPALRPVRLAGRGGLGKVASLASIGDGEYLAYFEGRPTVGWAKLAGAGGGHLTSPFELTPESWRLTLEGTGVQNGAFLARLRQKKIRYRVVSIGEAGVETATPKSLLSLLTTRQRQALLQAYRSGYYDIPRRVDSTGMARALSLGKSTTIEHRRKAEKRLLDEIIRG